MKGLFSIFLITLLCGALGACANNANNTKWGSASKVEAYGVIDVGYGYTHQTVEKTK